MRFRQFFLLMVFFGVFSACSKLDDLEQRLDSSIEMTSFAVFNAVPGSTGMELSLDNVNVGQDRLSYGSYLQHRNISAGRKDVLVQSKSKDKNETYRGMIDLPAGRVYSLFVTKDRSTLDIVKTEDNMIKPKPGYAKIRVAHMSSSAGSLILQHTDVKELFKDFKYKTVTDFIEIKSGENFPLSIYSSPAQSNLIPRVENNAFIPADQEIVTLLVSGEVNPTNGEEKLNIRVINHVTKAN